ncbi:MAG: nucleotidyl transferase AbiEii/AbiGii toxin family protein, partial [Chitinophagales bacterium]
MDSQNFNERNQMKPEWLKLTGERRIEILKKVSERSGLPPIAIEKDWWVTFALKASFEISCSPHLVFKGGTSLSKAWNLIERFSEDIDLAIDRNFLGFEGELS